MSTYEIKLRVNGNDETLDVRGDETLLRALRRIGYVEVKLSCEGGDCGACAILLDGVAVNACLVFAAQADGSEITTVRGGRNRRRPPPGSGAAHRKRRRAVRVLHARDRRIGEGAPG